MKKNELNSTYCVGGATHAGNLEKQRLSTTYGIHCYADGISYREILEKMYYLNDELEVNRLADKIKQD